MNKIGIITYHFALNYGAVLQCYALQDYLISNNINTTVINFISNEQYKNNSLSSKRDGLRNYLINLALLPFYNFRKIKKHKYNYFLSNYLNCTIKISDLKFLKKYLTENNYTGIICGSDQVWNPYIRDFNIAFFLPEIKIQNKITYAASIGKIESKDLIKYKNYMEDFNYISMRENRGKVIVQNLVKDKEIVQVLDPVFLLKKEKWEEFTKNSVFKPKKKNYLLFYVVNKNYFSLCYKHAKKVAKSLNLDILILNASYSINSFRKNTIHDAGPIDFVKLIANAKFIITDSFHGTVFSIIFEKQFFTFEPMMNNLDTRKTDLLNKLSLQSRIIYPNIVIRKDLDKKIDYIEINHLLNKYREESYDYLSNCLNQKNI